MVINFLLYFLITTIRDMNAYSCLIFILYSIIIIIVVITIIIITITIVIVICIIVMVV